MDEKKKTYVNLNEEYKAYMQGARTKGFFR